MCNHHLKDSNLSLKAKGLLSMMLSREGKLNDDSMLDIMIEQKKPEKNDITLSG